MRPGIVDLRDLGSRYAWDALKITRFVEAAGLVVGDETSRSFEAPRVLVLISPYEHAHLVQRARPWLAGTRHVVIVRDTRDADGIPEDPELVAIVQADWRDVLSSAASSRCCRPMRRARSSSSLRYRHRSRSSTPATPWCQPARS